MNPSSLQWQGGTAIRRVTVTLSRLYQIFRPAYFLCQKLTVTTTSDAVAFKDMSEQKDNPYLAHLPPSKRGAGPAISKAAESEPLFGFLPRKVTAKQVRKALVRSTNQWFQSQAQSFDVLLCFQEHDVNPFTKVPHTPQYKKILEARQKLPVYTQMDEFYKMVRQHLTFSCTMTVVSV